MALPPNALLEGIVDELAEEDDVVVDRLVLAAVKELVGPYSWLAAEPPETRPAEPFVLEPAMPVRMYRLRRSRGFCW
jgi:hypothetical protein